MSETIETTETYVPRRIRLGPNATRIATSEGGEDFSAQSLEAAIARLETEAAAIQKPGNTLEQKLDALDAKVDHLLEFQPEIRNAFTALRHLMSLILMSEDDQIQQLEIRINQRLDEMEGPLEKGAKNKRPDLSEATRAYFGEARAAQELERREKNQKIERER